jgi:lysophospholipase L1-like esterase
MVMRGAAGKWLAVAYFAILHLFVGLLLWKSDFIYKVNARLGWSASLDYAADRKSRQAAHVYLDRTDQAIRGAHPAALIGDSIVRDLPADMTSTHSLNLGLGGIGTGDIARILAAYPSLSSASATVLSIGINDLCIDRIDNAEFSRRIRKLSGILPREPRLLWISIAPVGASASSAACPIAPDQITRANAAIAAECALLPTCRYVDSYTALVGANGYLKDDFHLGDGIHLSRRGYQIWSQALFPHLKAQASVPGK